VSWCPVNAFAPLSNMHKSYEMTW